jgi:hypothetical protein
VWTPSRTSFNVSLERLIQTRFLHIGHEAVSAVSSVWAVARKVVPERYRYQWYCPFYSVSTRRRSLEAGSINACLAEGPCQQRPETFVLSRTFTRIGMLSPKRARGARRHNWRWRPTDQVSDQGARVCAGFAALVGKGTLNKDAACKLVSLKRQLDEKWKTSA